MANILIASLGESPVVVTAMYDLLTGQERLPIDKVVVLHPSGYQIDFGFDFINEALHNKCTVEAAKLPFEDANSEIQCYTFLQELALLLWQYNDDAVYLSLAGGRKNMSALMALLAPLFPCVKRLYHILDKREGTRKPNFLSPEELITLSPTDRHFYFFPDRNDLRLVDIPLDDGKHQHVSDEFIEKLVTITEEDLDELWNEDAPKAEIIETYRYITPSQKTRILEVLLTTPAMHQFQDLWQHDRTNARKFKLCFERMKFATTLRNLSHDIYSRKLRKGEHDIYSQNRSSVTFHFLKRKRTPQRPVFHTVPKDIRNCADEEVDRVIVSELEIEINEEYRSLEEITNSLTFPLGPPFPPANNVLDELVRNEADLTSKSILLVPLGPTPMIATQLYTLLSAQGHNIREVVLLYPAGLLEVRHSAELAKRAFDDEHVTCRLVPITGLKDIDSHAACGVYENKLEETIDDIRDRYSDDQIVLALSGGRKGMAALAMFVAQRKKIRYLYHTLITDTKLRQIVEDETTVSALHANRTDKIKRNDRLFLRVYEGTGPYTKFVCFRVPVLPGSNK